MKRLSSSENFFDIRLQRIFFDVLQENTISNEKIRDAFCIQIMTGARPGEVVALKWKHVNFETATLTIENTARRTKEKPSKLVIDDTKTHCKRELHLSPDALNILAARRLVDTDATPETLIFTNQRGGIIEPNSLNRYLRQYKAKMKELVPEGVEIPDVTAHGLRHTFATRAMEKGIPLPIVSEWLGHSSTRITGDVYSHVTSECSKSWQKKLDDIFKL